MVAVDEWGGVVALAGFIPLVHLDPVSIRTDHRHSKKILKHLWAEVRKEAQKQGIKAFTGLSKDPVIDKLMDWVGAKHLEGKLYVIPVNKEDLE